MLPVAHCVVNLPIKITNVLRETVVIACNFPHFNKVDTILLRISPGHQRSCLSFLKRCVEDIGACFRCVEDIGACFRCVEEIGACFPLGAMPLDLRMTYWPFDPRKGDTYMSPFSRNSSSCSSSSSLAGSRPRICPSPLHAQHRHANTLRPLPESILSVAVPS